MILVAETVSRLPAMNGENGVQVRDLVTSLKQSPKAK
jgi:hypothetical protein